MKNLFGKNQSTKRKIILYTFISILVISTVVIAVSYFREMNQNNETPATTNISNKLNVPKFLGAIKQVESEQPPRLGKLPTEAEIDNSPYIKHIRLALNGYLNGTNTGVEADALNNIGGSDCGLNNFDKTYYQSKFIIFDASDDDYGGVQADIVFVDKPDTIFWTWVYRLGGSGEYVLRGFCKNGPPEDQKTKFNDYFDSIKNKVQF